MRFSPEGCAWAAPETGAARGQYRSRRKSAARSNSRSAGHTRESRTFWVPLFLARRYREELLERLSVPVPENAHNKPLRISQLWAIQAKTDPVFVTFRPDWGSFQAET